MNKKIAIVMAYYNRKQLLINTLNKFRELYKGYNFEVIITDDKSNNDNEVDEIIHNYDFKIILLKVLDKNWINPCVAYNLAIRHISSDVEFVVFQNPEIYHLSNILDIVLEELKEGLYLTFPVFTSDNDKQTNNYINMSDDKIKNFFLNIKTIKNKISHKITGEKIGHWKDHPIYCSRNLHWLSSIHINDLKKIGGFDNSFKDGAWFDDNELLCRISNICKIKSFHHDQNNHLILGLHQFHPILCSISYELKKINEKLFNNLKSNIKNKNYNVYCDPKLDINYKKLNNVNITLNLNILTKDYLNVKPYPHCSIDNILPIDLAKKCQYEILNIPDKEWDRYNNPFEQKYTFRNKNNLPENCTILFNYLNSKKFIEQLSKIVNEKLYADPTKNWWGIHKYDNGDHLDIHSDAGVHPKTKQKKHVTLGIYLSKNWKEENLGHLEIWEGDSINTENHKLNKCVKKILPSFNKLILFNNSNNAWHGNPVPTKCLEDEKRIFVTVSYLSNNHENEYSNKHQKALFIKLPNEPENKEKDKLRLLRVDPERYKEIYNL